MEDSSPVISYHRESGICSSFQAESGWESRARTLSPLLSRKLGSVVSSWIYCGNVNTGWTQNSKKAAKFQPN